MQQAGRYRFVRRLGQGGMAEVHEAIAQGADGFSRRVAIKRILPELASDPSATRLFLDEARITSQLYHANIVGVHDFGVADAVPFQVLDFVDGLDLQRLLRRAQQRGVPPDPGLVVHIAVQVAHALDYAHRATDADGRPLSIVHRDVSPSNVLVSWDGAVRLTDFGIALAALRSERTEAGSTRGKLDYMAPEQAAGGDVDRRADIFSLGCLVHVAIAGQSPLAELGAITQLAQGGELTLAAEVPAPLRPALGKALRGARVDRYQTAGEFAEALGAVQGELLTGDPTVALQRWLQELGDEAAPGPMAGALDGLLNVQMVLAPATEGDLRSFTLQKVQPDILPGAQPASRPPRMPRALWLMALLVLVAAAWVLGRALYNPSPVQPPSTPVASEVVGAPRAPVEQPGAVPAAPIPAPTSEQVVAEPQTDAAASPVAAPPRARPRHRPRKTLPAQPPNPPPRATSSARGVLLVGGAGAHRAEIFVDGKSRGFAPKRLELKVGSHKLMLVRPDGTRLGPRTWTLSRRHTRSSPQRWMIDE